MPRKRAGYMSMSYTPNYAPRTPRNKEYAETLGKSEGRSDAFDVLDGERATRSVSDNRNDLLDEFGTRADELMPVFEAAYRKGFNWCVAEYEIEDTSGFDFKQFYL